MAFLVLKNHMYTPVTYMCNMVFARKRKQKNQYCNITFHLKKEGP